MTFNGQRRRGTTLVTVMLAAWVCALANDVRAWMEDSDVFADKGIMDKDSIGWTTADKDNAWTGNVNVYAGVKTMDKDVWQPAHEHAEIGLLTDIRRKQWPVGLAADLLLSRGRGVVGGFDVENRTAEANLGLRMIWDQFGLTRLHIGGGVALIRAEGEFTSGSFSFSDKDSGTGYWVNAGLCLTFENSFNIGIDLRYSAADITVFDVDAKAGGGHAGLILGVNW